MALTHSEPVQQLKQAPGFKLKGVLRGEVRDFELKDFSKAKALVVVFMCNHCPYVIAIQERLNLLAAVMSARDVAFVGINSNDVLTYPQDSFEEMKKRAAEMNYAFPYLIDDTQEVARAYGAVCTPDFFVFAPGHVAQPGQPRPNERLWSEKYRGRLDDSWKDPKLVKTQDLALAIEQILKGKETQSTQVSSMGCNIKWKKG